MKAYLDTNVISAIARDDTPQESAAVETLLRASEQGLVELMTSRVTEEEIARYSGSGRIILDRVYRLIRKVAYVETSNLLGFNTYGDRYTWISSPLMEDDPTWTRLKGVGLRGVRGDVARLSRLFSEDVRHVSSKGRRDRIGFSRLERPQRTLGGNVVAVPPAHPEGPHPRFDRPECPAENRGKLALVGSLGPMSGADSDRAQG